MPSPSVPGVTGDMTIGALTFSILLGSMLAAIIDREQIPTDGSDYALQGALYAALDGDRERVLIEVAGVLDPAPGK